jgi:transcriptional regulator with XRE-family HTH domain
MNIMFNYKRLKQLRTELKLSQEEMGNTINMAQPTYHRYETGETPLNFAILYAIQEKHGIDPSEFIVTKSNIVNVENGSTNNGNGILQAENYYTFPKEIIDTLITNQQTLLNLLKERVDKQK